MRFHHLGIATHDVTATSSVFETVCDAPVVHREEFDGLTVRFLELDTGYLELLSPVTENTVSRFLDRDGPGIHHVAFETPALQSTLDSLAANGVTLIDEDPRPGAWGHEVAFLHPDDTGGVLIELVAAD